MITGLRDLAVKILAGARVVAGAWPTWAAAATGLLTLVSTALVPLLPGGWATRVAAWTAAGLGAVAAVSAAVARVTPVLYGDARGVLAPRPRQLPPDIDNVVDTTF